MLTLLIVGSAAPSPAMGAYCLSTVGDLAPAVNPAQLDLNAHREAPSLAARNARALDMTAGVVHVRAPCSAERGPRDQILALLAATALGLAARGRTRRS